MREPHPRRCRNACAFVAFAVLCAILPSAAVAREHPEIPDPVRSTLDRCLAAKNTRTTIDIRTCYGAAERTYETHLARAYARVLRATDPKSRAAIRASQAAWLVYRDRMRTVDRSPWTSGRGTIVGIEADETAMNVVRTRLLELDLIDPGFAGEAGSLSL